MAPYKQLHKELLEAVQRRATMTLPCMKKLTCRDRLNKLALATLSYVLVEGPV
jgi:hypothetical protein